MIEEKRKKIREVIEDKEMFGVLYKAYFNEFMKFFEAEFGKKTFKRKLKNE